MGLHIVHFIGPINHSSACTIRNLCLQALQSGASEIELHLSTEGGNMTAGFALYFFLKSLPLPLTTHNIGSIEAFARHRMARMPRFRRRTLRHHLRGSDPRRPAAGPDPQPPVRQRPHLRRRAGIGGRHHPPGGASAATGGGHHLALVERVAAPPPARALVKLASKAGVA
jgi:hypothetical protein